MSETRQLPTFPALRPEREGSTPKLPFAESRPAGPTADQIRAGGQYEDCRGARPDDPAIDPRRAEVMD